MNHDQDTVRRLVAYHDQLSVPFYEVEDDLVRGRRFLMRRRVLTAAGSAAVALAIAGTIGVLAPRPGDGDALPAVPTATTTPAPEVTPSTPPPPSATPTPTATPSPTSTATTTSTATPTRTQEPDPPGPSATPTPTRAPEPGPTPDATPTTRPPTTTPTWTAFQRIGDGAFRMRAVEEPPAEGQRSVAANLDSPDFRVTGYLRIEERAPDAKQVSVADLDLRVLLTNWAVVDVISENGEPLAGESIGRFTLSSPLTGKPLRFTVVTMPRPVTMAAPMSAKSLTLRLADGSVISIDDGTVTSQPGG